MITLAVDASTYVGSVAVFDGDRLVAEETAPMRGKESERLMPAIASALRAASRRPGNIDRVICGAGPGSFTSLRIAASEAKGLAVGLGVPLYVVSSLSLIVAANAPVAAGGGERYLAVLDALRGECYVATCVVGREVRVEGGTQVVPASEVESIAATAGLRAVGPGRVADWHPHARGAMRTGPTGPVNLAGWEPDYGRPAEAQARWENAHGRALPT